MNIDVHAHVVPLIAEKINGPCRDFIPTVTRNPDGQEGVTASGLPFYPIPRQIYDIDLRIREMHRNEIDMQLLSVFPFLIRYDLDPGIGDRYSRALNDALAEIIRRHPNKFLGLATLPLQNPRLAVKELERAMIELGMKGVQITNEINGKDLDWPDLRPFYEKAEELGAFISCHPGAFPGSEQIRKYYLRNLLGNPFATSLAIATLIFGGILENFPELRFCFAHGGGFVPYQKGRLEQGSRVRDECRTAISKSFSDYLKLLYFDTVTHYKPALEYLIKTVGTERVLLGSDYPFDMADPDPVATVNSIEILVQSEKNKILGGTFMNLVGISKI